MGKRLLLLLLLIVGVLVVAVAAAFLETSYTKRAAVGFLETSRTLEVGATSYAEASDKLARFQAKAQMPEPCSPKHCRVDYQFKNDWVSPLHISPPTGFDTSLEFRDGILVRKEMSLGQGLCCVVLVRESGTPTATFQEAAPAFLPLLIKDGSGRPWKAIITLTPQASQEDRDRAYSFNLNCLTKIRGCSDASELLPAVWSLHE